MDEVVAKSMDVHENIAMKLIIGDESVCEDILRNYAPKIQKRLLLLPFKLSIEDAEDIVCEAIMRLWEKREQYDDSKASVRIYLYRIAENLLRDRPKTSRFKTMRQERYVGDEYLKTLAAPKKKSESRSNKDPEEPILVALREELRKLPDNQRRVLIEDAGATNELSAPELGDILEVPAGTIRQWRKRSKDTLRHRLAKRGFGCAKD